MTWLNVKLRFRRRLLPQPVSPGVGSQSRPVHPARLGPASWFRVLAAGNKKALLTIWRHVLIFTMKNYFLVGSRLPYERTTTQVFIFRLASIPVIVWRDSLHLSPFPRSPFKTPARHSQRNGSSSQLGEEKQFKVTEFDRLACLESGLFPGWWPLWTFLSAPQDDGHFYHWC